MNHPAPGLDTAVEAAADCVRLYQAALDAIGDQHPPWQDFMERMLLRRETLLHRLRFIGENRIEAREAEDLSGWRSWLGEIGLSLKKLLDDPVRSALTTIEQAETRLVESLGAIGVVTADPDELIEIVHGVTEERDAVRFLLDGLDGMSLSKGTAPT